MKFPTRGILYLIYLELELNLKSRHHIIYLEFYVFFFEMIGLCLRISGKGNTVKRSIGPVSYTHLDVYKRQEQRIKTTGGGLSRRLSSPRAVVPIKKKKKCI